MHSFQKSLWFTSINSFKSTKPTTDLFTIQRKNFNTNYLSKNLDHHSKLQNERFSDTTRNISQFKKLYGSCWPSYNLSRFSNTISTNVQNSEEEKLTKFRSDASSMTTKTKSERLPAPMRETLSRLTFGYGVSEKIQGNEDIKVPKSEVESITVYAFNALKLINFIGFSKT